MHLDPEFLSRIQFAWVIGWHILLPAFTIGLASFIAFLEGAYALTKRAVFLNLSQFWLRIFAISFGMGVVTGIVMPFQFGTNWSRFSDVAGNIISPLLAYEGLMAFFLESTFLGVLLFGRKLVPPAMHFVAAVLVAGGTLLSAFWILATNSWMQTPAGYEMIDGRFFPKDWFEIVFSPSLPFRFMHTVSAFYVTTAFVVLGVGAYTVRRGQSPLEGRMMLRLALWFLAIFVPIQAVLGDLHGLEHARVPAGQARGDRRLVGRRQRRAGLDHRLARPERRAQHRRDRDPETRQSLSHPFVERRRQRPEGFPGRSAAAGRGGLFRLPHHGRHRAIDAGDGGLPDYSCCGAGGSMTPPGISKPANSPSVSALSR